MCSRLAGRDIHKNPEMSLALLCSQTDVKNAGRLDNLLDEDIDWDRVLQLVQKHGTAQLTYHILSEGYRDRVPKGILESLRRQNQRTSVSNMSFVQDLIEITDLASKADIPILPYKGPVLASVVYEDISLRSFSDVDFLIKRKDIKPLKSVLIANGYQPKYNQQETNKLSPAQEWVYIRFRRDYRFENPENGNAIELQWRLVSLPFPPSITLETVWDRRKVVSIAGNDIEVLSTEDRLLVLSVHGSRHLWERIEWLSDINELLRNRTVDWDLVLRRAREHNCLRMFILGPVLVHELFGTEIPERVMDIYESDPQVQDALTTVLTTLFNEQPGNELATRRVQSQLLDRYCDKVRFWSVWALNPEHEDIEKLSLPFPLIPLYSLIRVTRSLRKYVRKQIDSE